MDKRPTTAVAASLLALGLTGCGTQPSPSDEATSGAARVAGTPSPGPVGGALAGGVDADAQQALQVAIAQIQAEEITAFRAETSFGSILTVTEGAMTAEGWRASTQYDDRTTAAVPDSTFQAVSTDGRVWMQTDWEGPRAGCWLALGPEEVPVGIVALRPNEPAYVSALGYLSASRFTDESRRALEGSLRLDAAVSLLTGQLLENIADLANLEREAVPVLVGLDGTRVSRITVDGGDLLAAIARSGATANAKAQTVLKATSVTVDYPRPGPVEIAPPPLDLQFTADAESCR